MISNKLSSKKMISSVVVLAVVAVGAILYFSSLKKSPEVAPRIKTNQSATSAAPTSDQSVTADKTSMSDQQEPEKLTPIKNVSPTSKPAQAELDRIDTSNWKIYTDPDYGYEIKYPSDWSIIAQGDSGVNFLAPETPKFNPGEPGEGDVWISTQKSGPSYAPEWYFEKTSVTVNGNKAILYMGVDGGQDTQYPDISYTTLALEKDSKEINIQYPDHLEEKDGAKYIGIYYKMIDTFKFTE
ncbi:MAG: hypothetical protein WCQ96_03965 [Patescibacteria group bacterium]